MTQIPEIQLGKLNSLRIVKEVDFGFYLEGAIRGHREEILLPRGEASSPLPKVDEEVTAFLYLDQEERLVASMRTPLAQVGDFAFLETSWVNNYGTFLNWGMLKDLFVPFREQKQKMQKGQKYIVHVHLDEETYRIVASAKIERYFSHEFPPYQVGDEVDILIWQKTDLGLKAIVDNRFPGLLYDNQMFRHLQTGDRTKAFISQVRPDGKIDLILQRAGHASVLDFSEILLQHLQTNGGFTPLGDKSPAEEIYAMFGVSKKVFKKAVGDLYKHRIIEITEDGIHLIHKP